MMLVERGLVDLGASVEKYIGDIALREYEGTTAEVTIKRLLHHTAGLPTMWYHVYADELASRPELSKTIARYGIIASPPGERVIYSGIGDALLEFVIEQVTGASYDHFLKQEIFEPLGLKNAAVITKPYDDPAIAQKYAGGRRLECYDNLTRGASSVYISAQDLARFGMFHLKQHLPDQKVVLSDKSIDLMHNSHDTEVPGNYYRLPSSGSALLALRYSMVSASTGYLALYRTSPKARNPARQLQREIDETRH